MTGRMYVPIGYMRSGDVPEKEEGLIEKLDSKTGEWGWVGSVRTKLFCF